MKTHRYLFLLCLLLPLALRSQTGPAPAYLYYRLTNEEASAFFHDERLRPQPQHFHSPVKDWPLPPGHYLRVRETEGLLSVVLESFNSISIEALQEREKFAFRVLDSLGAPVPGAKVWSGKRRLRFDPKRQAFVLKKVKKNGSPLRVEAPGLSPSGGQGEVAFFELREKDNYYYRSHRWRFFKRLAFPFAHPLRWSRGKYNRVRYWAQAKYLHHSERKDWYRGYIALSKPRYLPGDTLKVKGWFTKKNGRPIRRPLELRIIDRGKPLKIKTVEPSEPGVYAAEVLLHDSLKLSLNRDYEIAFYERARNTSFEVFRQRFRYEEYLLDEVTYVLSTPKTEYTQGDSIWLSAEGKFSNGLSIPDGFARLVVRTDVTHQNLEPTAFLEPSMQVPDTLWTHEQALDPDSPTLLLLPDSIFPKVKIRVTVSALFSNSNGELQSKSLHFNWKPRPNCLALRLDGAWLRGECSGSGDSGLGIGDSGLGIGDSGLGIGDSGLGSGDSGLGSGDSGLGSGDSGLGIGDSGLGQQGDTAWLRVSGRDFDYEKAVTLPFQERVNGSVWHYDLRFSPKEMPAQMSIGMHKSMLSARGEHRGDSLFFGFQNPRLLPIHFELFKSKTLVESGWTEAENPRFERSASPSEDFRLVFRYHWAGDLQEEGENFLFFKKRLDISIEQPAVIEPGATVQVKVKVKDGRQRDARNVQLVAGAINAQFGEQEHFTVPKLRRKMPRFRRRFPDIVASEAELSPAFMPLTKDWASKLRLDTAFLFPENGLYLRYDTVTKDSLCRHIAQFAPYLVTGGRQQAVLMIYCNRQLVYWQGAGDQQPYSFVGREGWNHIVLRTRHFEYELDSVWLKKGHKLTLAIDPIGYWDIGILGYSGGGQPGNPQPLKGSLLETGSGSQVEASDPVSNGRPLRGLGGELGAANGSPIESSALKINKRKVPEQWTETEKKLIANSFFVLRPTGGGIHAVSQGSGNIHVFRTEGKGGTQLIPLGPFRSSEPLRYVLRDGFRSDFVFEPGFSYSLSGRRERLYEYKWFEREVSLPPLFAPIWRRGDLVYTLSDIVETSPMRHWQELQFSTAPGSTGAGKGIFQFYFSQKKPVLLAIWLEGIGVAKPEIFKPHHRTFHDLSPGKYRIMLLAADSSFLEQEFEVLPNTLLFRDFNALPFQQDGSGRYLEMLRQHSLSLSKSAPIFPSHIPQAKPMFWGDVVIGTVTDATGEPLIGASVFAKGTNIGTVTDIDGSYSIHVPPGTRTLVFHYIGFEKQEVEIGYTGEVSVTMNESSAHLQEVVVTGYSTAKRSDMTAAIRGVEVTASEEKRFAKKMNATLEDIEQEDLQKFRGDKFSKEEGRPHSDSNRNPLRKNFRDEGYWQPRLSTDRNGEAYFTVTFPDNVTQWRSFALGMDRRQRVGLAFARTDAFRKVMAQLALPRFLVEGDRAEVVGKALNYTGDSLAVTTTFEQGGQILKTGEAILGNALVEKVTLVGDWGLGIGDWGLGIRDWGLGIRDSAYVKRDSLTLRYSLSTHHPINSSTQFLDGEERSIPIYPRGVDESRGGFYILEGDTALLLSLSSHAQSLIPNPQSPINLYAESDALEILSSSFDYLIEYPYGCNEQVASKLIALLLAKRLKAILGQPFEQEDYILKAIGTLTKSQAQSGHWGWWQHGAENIWMSSYVLHALVQAKAAGYAVPALERGLVWLSNRIHLLQGRPLLDALELLSSIGQNMDYEGHLSRLDTSLRQPSLNEQLTVLKIRQAQQLPYSLDLLEKNRKMTLHGGIYWGEPGARHWYNNATQETLLAYHLLKKAGKTEHLAAIERYLLRQRGRQGAWGNTLETARVLEALLPSFLEKNGDTRRDASLRITVGGQVIDLTNLQDLSKLKFQPDDSLRIEKTGAANVYLTAYQSFWNPDPAPKTDIFDVSTQLTQHGRPTSTLEASQPAMLDIELTASAEAEYVMLEVPIPAGCAYGSTEQANYSAWRNGQFAQSHEVHREYFKEKVAIFIERLPAGKHRFTVSLEPRFTGRYTMNPARAEEMYFPVFYGRNGISEVVIGH